MIRDQRKPEQWQYVTGTGEDLGPGAYNPSALKSGS